MDDDNVRRELAKLPRLHDHLFHDQSGTTRFHDVAVCQSCKEEAGASQDRHQMARAIRGFYVDWILRRDRCSREACIQCIFTVGLWSDDPTEAAAFLLFGVLSGNCDPRQAIAKLQPAIPRHRGVFLVVHVLETGAEGLAEKIRQACLDDLACCPAVVWLTNQVRSPFVDWVLSKFTFCDASVDNVPHEARIAAMISSAAADIAELLRIFDVATRNLRPYDRVVYHLLRSLADAYGKRGHHQLELRCLRQALSVAHRRHIAFGDLSWDAMLSAIAKAQKSRNPPPDS